MALKVKIVLMIKVKTVLMRKACERKMIPEILGRDFAGRIFGANVCIRVGLSKNLGEKRKKPFKTGISDDEDLNVKLQISNF